MNVQFEFTNTGVEQATWVFVSQQYDPDAATDSAAVPFKPMPWLRLNPSRNARECFRWTGRVSAQAWARRGGAEYCSPCVSVRPTNAYLLVPQVEDVLIAWVERNEDPACTMVCAPAQVNDAIMAIDWYLDDNLVGRNEGLQPGSSCRYAPGQELLFLPMPPDYAPMPVTEQQLEQASAYCIPSFARLVQVVASPDPTRPLGVRYRFIAS